MSSRTMTRSAQADGVNLRSCARKFIALLGPNGARKTALFQLLSGLFVLNFGRVEIM
jgi:ABC-type branched-subunit amino acid transport system ATPase component